MKDEFYVPNIEDINYQSKYNKQGRSEDEVPSGFRQKIINCLIEEQQRSYEKYEEFLNLNISRELARINLPLSLYTEWYWKIDLHNLFHFLKVRMDKTAQKEIRAYANKMVEITEKVAPIAYESFEDYSLNSMQLSGLGAEVISEIMKRGVLVEEIKNIDKMLENSSKHVSEIIYYNLRFSKLELKEFKEKLEHLL